MIPYISIYHMESFIKRRRKELENKLFLSLGVIFNFITKL